MKIGIIGTGNMGRSLGVVWQRLGHDVLFGGRDRQKAAAAASLAPGSISGTNDDAATFGDALLYTPRGVAASEVLREPSLTRGKIVIDCSNQPSAPDLKFAPITLSIAEQLSAELPGASVVKAFNTLPQEVFELCPDEIRQYHVAVFVAADDAAARATVVELASSMGFHAVDCGVLHQARLLEGAGYLIRLVIRAEGIGVNFAIARPPMRAEPTLGGRQPTKLR